MNIRLPSIDANTFSKGFIFRKVLRSAQEQVWPLLNKVGETHFKKLIDEDRSFVELIPVNKIPESWKAAIPQAGQYKFIDNIITDADYFWLLPEWLAALVVRDSKSWAWFLKEVSNIKKIAFGG